MTALPDSVREEAAHALFAARHREPYPTTAWRAVNESTREEHRSLIGAIAPILRAADQQEMARLDQAGEEALGAVLILTEQLQSAKVENERLTQERDEARKTLDESDNFAEFQRLAVVNAELERINADQKRVNETLTARLAEVADLVRPILAVMEANTGGDYSKLRLLLALEAPRE